MSFKATTVPEMVSPYCLPPHSIQDHTQTGVTVYLKSNLKKNGLKKVSRPLSPPF